MTHCLNKYTYWSEEEILESSCRNTMYASTNQVQLLGNQQGERMDKIGEANKPFEARISDLLEVERRKKDDDEKTVVVYQPKDVEVIDTSAFIKTNMEYGLDFVFRLVDSVNLIQSKLKIKTCPQGVAW